MSLPPSKTTVPAGAPDLHDDAKSLADDIRRRNDAEYVSQSPHPARVLIDRAALASFLRWFP